MSGDNLNCTQPQRSGSSHSLARSDHQGDSVTTEFEELIRLLSPPAKERIPVVDWQLVVEELGHPLPDDYRLFCDTYGPGSINQFAWIYHPYAGLPEKTFGNTVDTMREYLQFLLEQDDDRKIPSADRLLPCGGTDNGHCFAWKMEGSPNRWPIVVFDNKGYVYDSGERSIVRFLLSLLTGESRLFNKVIASSWFDSPRFIP